MRSRSRSLLSLLSLLSLPSLLTLGACADAPSADGADEDIASSQHEVVTSSTLFSELWGFGSSTTGGLGGENYVVTRTDDADVPGTLRYGVESLSGPRWIVFDPVVFPPTTKKAIYLTRQLNLESDTTIDGRGSYVSIRRRYDNSVVTWKQVPSGQPVWECFVKERYKERVGPLLAVRSVSNVIITHLDFAQLYEGPYDPEVAPPAGATLDKQCFGDVISVYNVAEEAATRAYTDIWINHNDFSNCGDECVAVTWPNVDRRAYLTISNNKFSNTYKGIILGLGNPEHPDFRIAASVYRNRFVSTHIRQPRVEEAYAHVYNNLYEDWIGHAVQAWSKSRVMIEQNVFRAVSNTSGVYGVHSSDDVRVWARKNHLYNVTSPSKYQTAWLSCGSAWYYPCIDNTVIDLHGLSYAAARDQVRAWAGWKAVANDVR